MQRLRNERVSKIHRYFDEKNSRSNYSVRLWKNTHKEWNQLSDEERRLAAYERAYMHNRSKNRVVAFRENNNILCGLLDYCKQKELELCVIVPPATKHYRDALHDGYREAFYSFVDKYSNDIKVIDLFDSQMFTDEEFNDMDHLNDEGAKKLTRLVLGKLT